MEKQHLILWDGECGFCRRAVKWFQRHDKHKMLTATPFQQAPSPPMTPELAAACEKAVHVITAEGTTLRAGRAALFLLEQIGWKFVARLLSLPPLIWLVEFGYGVIARNRPFFARFFFTREE